MATRAEKKRHIWLGGLAFQASVVVAAVAALTVGVGVTPAYATPSLSISVDTFTRDPQDGRAHYVITAEASGVSCGSCGIMLEFQKSDGAWVDTNSNWYFGNPVVFDSYRGWTDETIVAARVHLINAGYEVQSSAVAISDVQRSTSIDLTVNSFTRDSEDARIFWDTTIDVSALREANCTYAPCYMQLYAEYEGIGERLLYSGSVSNRYFSSFDWDGQVGYWNKMIRMQARYGNVTSPWISVSDSPRDKAIQLTVNEFTRDQTDGRVWWDVTAEFFHADSSSCQWDTCQATLVAQDYNGNEYQMYLNGIHSTYHSSQTWNAFFGYWKSIKRIQVRFQDYASNWVAVKDTSRQPEIAFVVDTFVRNPTTGHLDYDLDLNTSALDVNMCGQIGGCSISLFAVDSNGVDHQLTGGYLTNWYTQTFPLSGSYSGTQMIVNLRAEYGGFTSEWIASSETVTGGHDINQAADLLIAYAGAAGLGLSACSLLFPVGSHTNLTSLTDQDVACRSALAVSGTTLKQAVAGVLLVAGSEYVNQLLVKLGVSRPATGMNSAGTLPGNCAWVNLEISCSVGGTTTLTRPDDAPPVLDSVYEQNLYNKSNLTDPVDLTAAVTVAIGVVVAQEVRKEMLRSCIAQVSKTDSATGLTTGAAAGLTPDDCGTKNLFLVGPDLPEPTAHDVSVIASNPESMLLTYASGAEKGTKPDWRSTAACLPADFDEDCDEYPYWATEENTVANPPHLLPIDSGQNQYQGSLYSAFVRKCALVQSPRNSVGRKFIVVESWLLPTGGLCGKK